MLFRHHDFSRFDLSDRLLYGTERVVAGGETVTSTGVTGLRLPVDEMFG